MFMCVLCKNGVIIINNYLEKGVFGEMMNALTFWLLLGQAKSTRYPNANFANGANERNSIVNCQWLMVMRGTRRIMKLIVNCQWLIVNCYAWLSERKFRKRRK